MLVEAALRPGVSVARLALEHGVNANLLRKWITKYLMQRDGTRHAATQTLHAVETIDVVAHDMPLNDPVGVLASSFVPLVAAAPNPPVEGHEPQPEPATPIAIALQVRLPNGVEFDLRQAGLEELTTVVQMLGRLPCSGSTKG